MQRILIADARARRTYVAAIAVLLILFIGRVAAQLAQYFHPVTFLPAFSDWHSGTLPYGLLVASQAAIIAACVYYVFKIAIGALTPNKSAGKFLLVFGVCYFVFMTFRLVAGLTFLSDNHWFQAHLPAAFHIVLASIVLVFADFHLRFGKEESSRRAMGKALLQWSAYPVVMLGGMLLLWLLLQAGVPLAW